MMNKNTIIEMIPEYLNGNLSDDDIKAIESAAKENEVIQMEIEFIKSIQKQVQSEKINSPADWGWARLKQTIEKEGVQPILQTQSEQSIIKPIWRKVAIAASFAFVMQSAYLVQQQIFNDTDYRLLSTELVKNSIQVQFKEGTNEKEIRLLLAEMKGNIVGGPSALGIYSIQFKDRDLALSTLKNKTIIEYAELTE